MVRNPERSTRFRYSGKSAAWPRAATRKRTTPNNAYSDPLSEEVVAAVRLNMARVEVEAVPR